MEHNLTLILNVKPLTCVVLVSTTRGALVRRLAQLGAVKPRDYYRKRPTETFSMITILQKSKVPPRRNELVSTVTISKAI
jgi:hypothetical protein